MLRRRYAQAFAIASILAVAAGILWRVSQMENDAASLTAFVVVFILVMTSVIKVLSFGRAREDTSPTE